MCATPIISTKEIFEDPPKSTKDEKTKPKTRESQKTWNTKPQNALRRNM